MKIKPIEILYSVTSVKNGSIQIVMELIRRNLMKWKNQLKNINVLSVEINLQVNNQ